MSQPISGSIRGRWITDVMETPVCNWLPVFVSYVWTTPLLETNTAICRLSSTVVQRVGPVEGESMGTAAVGSTGSNVHALGMSSAAM